MAGETAGNEGIYVKCPYCGQRSRTARSHLGSTGKCKCGRAFIIAEEHTRDCPTCGQSNLAVNKTCSVCGGDLVASATPARAVTQPQPARQEKPCPFCGEPILAVARKCRYCVEFLDASDREDRSNHPSTALSVPESGPAFPTRAQYNPSDDTFAGTTALLVKLAMRAIQELGWKLESANENLGLVTFETGMTWGSWSGVSCSLNIEQVSPNNFRLIGTAKQNVRGGQILAVNLFGEAQGKARKAIDKMKELAS